ncbi:MAG: GNAT family N-acetyltransferase, partial [Eubacterium sp.]|nr:GNAT family N-acetyltransferase [Eubacterium sp.]
MDIQLVKIKQCELKAAWHMQQLGFLDVFLKYLDFINPIFNSYKRFTKYFKKCDMYWIIAYEKRVGQIWIGIQDSNALLARIFILKKYRNKGIAQQAILLAEAFYPDSRLWRLDTIKQEECNCHLYEKLGYIPTGVEKK